MTLLLAAGVFVLGYSVGMLTMSLFITAAKHFERQEEWPGLTTADVMHQVEKNMLYGKLGAITERKIKHGL